MTEIKSCPICNRSYSDSSLSFCLEDGSLLSASFQLENQEETTVIKSSNKERAGSEYWRRYSEFIDSRDKIARKFKKTLRTEKEYPILDTVPIFERPLHKWSSSEYIRQITFEITGLHTFHSQENLVILQEFFNEFVIDKGSKILTNSTMRLGVANFYNRNGKGFSYDFQRKNIPTKEAFIKTLNNYLEF